MLKSILVGVNGTGSSNAAAQLAMTMARASGAELVCIGVADIDALEAGTPVPLGGSTAKAERDAVLGARERARIGVVLEETAAQAVDAGVPCRAILAEGSPADELCLEAQSHDLLLMGRRALPRTDRDPAPSDVVSDVIQKSPRPVIIAAGADEREPSVLIAWDGSRGSARALASFVASGLYAGSRIHVASVGDDEDVAMTQLRRATDYLVARGRTATGKVLPVGEGVVDTLERYARELAATMIVMGASGQSRLKEALFGSVTRSMAARSQVTLFVDH